MHAGAIFGAQADVRNDHVLNRMLQLDRCVCIHLRTPVTPFDDHVAVAEIGHCEEINLSESIGSLAWYISSKFYPQFRMEVGAFSLTRPPVVVGVEQYLPVNVSWTAHLVHDEVDGG